MNVINIILLVVALMVSFFSTASAEKIIATDYSQQEYWLKIHTEPGKMLMSFFCIRHPG